MMKRTRSLLFVASMVAGILGLVGHARDAAGDEGGLVAHYRFDETTGQIAEDASGRHHNGLVTGGTPSTSDLAPIPANVAALRLNADGFVAVPGGADFEFGPKDPMTLSVWFKPIASRDLYHIIGKRARCLDMNYQLAVDGGTQGMSLHFNAGRGAPYRVDTGFAPPVGRFTHAAVVYDGNRLTIYVNGVPVATKAPYALPSTAVGSDLLLGSTGGCRADQNFPGVLDDVRVYRRALSESEIGGLAAVDSDGDGLPDSWETQSGLNPNSTNGADGSLGDPDGDGRTNLQEYLAATHPRGFFTRYFAEGATNQVFDTRIALANPGTTGARALLRYFKSTGSMAWQWVDIPPMTRRTVETKAVEALTVAEFSTEIESDQRLIVDRTMTWANGQAYGAHAETAVEAPALTWYLAEGATHSTFNLFYLLQNPNETEAQVRVRYLRPSGAPLEKTYLLGANSRTNIWVDLEEFPGSGKALANTDVSAVLEVLNGQPIIVERAMYAEVPGQMFGAGHESAGVTTPAEAWFLAEGATGPYFDLFVLVANPGATDAQVEATYLLPDGSTVVKPYQIAANSRFNIWVDLEDVRLADTAVSTTLRSTNGVPVIVERAMWWPGTGWYEAHNSAGATTTGTLWAVAEGEVDASRNLDTYLLLANTSSTPADVKVTLLFEDGTRTERTFAGIPSQSRFNVPAGWYFPQAAGKRFGAVVESLGAAPAQIVVERAMYWDASGQPWAAGTNALATKLR